MEQETLRRNAAIRKESVECAEMHISNSGDEDVQSSTKCFNLWLFGIFNWISMASCVLFGLHAQIKYCVALGH